MELYTLDSLFRRSQVIDVFESLIWTDRWREMGDFGLVMKSTLGARNLLTKGTHLALNESYRVMKVLEVEDTVDEDGKGLLNVKGKSLEHIFGDRAAMYDLDTNPWILTGLPQEVAEEMFDRVVRSIDRISPYDSIPHLVTGSYFDPGTIPPYGTSILWEQKPEDLYTALKGICDLYDLGFRLIRDPELNVLHFEIYSGDDRTTRQTDFTPIIFSPKLDNLQNTTEFSSIQEAKNAAYVYSEQGSTIVYAEGVDPAVEGFDRRVLVAEVTGHTEETSPATVLEDLEQKGYEELQKARGISIFDGEVDQRGDYVYEVDWRVGDLVEMRNKDGITSYKRATEAILVSDGEGDRIYPTLAEAVVPAVDTWAALNNDPRTWLDMTTETWEDM